MNKNRIRLTESDLHRIVRNGVRRVLKEWHSDELVLHYIETDYDGRHYYYDDNKTRYIGKGGTPEHPMYLYDVCGSNWEPDSEVECDNIHVIKESKKKATIYYMDESKLYKVIKESLNRVIKSKVKNKKRVIKESKSNWRGCPNVQMIWHGQWSDPELCADGYVANYWDVENSLWQSFLEETGHTDAESDNEEVEEEFSSWLQANESEVISTIVEYGSEF